MRRSTGRAVTGSSEETPVCLRPEASPKSGAFDAFFEGDCLRNHMLNVIHLLVCHRGGRAITALAQDNSDTPQKPASCSSRNLVADETFQTAALSVSPRPTSMGSGREPEFMS